MKAEYFKITCKVCGGDKIQTTMEKDYGYSNYTVEDTGYIEFKCRCGKFGSTDEYKNKPANDLDNFDVRCLDCDSYDWGFEIQDVDEEQKLPTHIYCKKCKNKWYQGIQEDMLKNL